MDSAKYWTVVSLLLLGTVGGGILHGTLTHRWGGRHDAQIAKRRLEQSLPDRVGNWRLLQETALTPEDISMLQCAAYISRVYGHEQTGDVVKVAVLLGPSGPISVHTPEVCYSSRDFEVSSDRKRVSLSDSHGVEHSMWEVVLDSKSLENSAIRAIYAWSTGANWDATDSPRYRYGGEPYLYKLQIAGGVTEKRLSDQLDPLAEFLKHFLPQVQPLLIDTKSPLERRL